MVSNSLTFQIRLRLEYSPNNLSGENGPFLLNSGQTVSHYKLNETSLVLPCRAFSRELNIILRNVRLIKVDILPFCTIPHQPSEHKLNLFRLTNL